MISNVFGAILGSVEYNNTVTDKSSLGSGVSSTDAHQNAFLSILLLIFSLAFLYSGIQHALMPVYIYIYIIVFRIVLVLDSIGIG